MPVTTLDVTPDQIAMARDDSGRLDMEKLQKIADGSYQENDFDSCEVACLGVPGGDRDFVLVPSLARIRLLSMIESPFLDDSEDSVMPNIIETAVAAYILAHGPESLTLLFAAARFEERLPIFERLAEHSAEHMEAVADCIDSLCQTWAKFEGRALAWFEVVTAEIPYYQAVADVNDAIQTTIEAYHRVPDDED